MSDNLSPEVAAVYFPAYHRDALNDKWYGEGFSEWDLLAQTRPLFPGHEQPKRCIWGDFDEADPQWMEKQIDLAADHGITTFLFDWYWYEGAKFLHRALEDGFLKARNRHRLKYFVMWANHTWGVFPACRERFQGVGGEGKNFGQALTYDKPLMEIRHSLDDLETAAAYCVEKYMREPNYLKIDGKPVFGFWRWEELETQLGSIEAVSEGLERMRGVARRAGYDGLHIMVNVANYEGPQTTHCWWPGLIERVKSAGADSVFGYNVARTEGFSSLTDEWPVVPYDDVLKSHEQLFHLCEGRGLPFHPVATVGFDNTPRWHEGAKLPIDFRRLQYEPIVVGNTPEKFGRAVELALQSVQRQQNANQNSKQNASPIILLNAWNEWTEGCYLLPEERVGNGYLEALRKALS